MNKFRKILIGLVIAAGAACLGGAAACNQGDGSGASSGEVPEYYQLDLKGSGVDFVFQGELAELDDKGEGFRSGGKVKEGVEVRFTVLVGANATGTPVVSLNNEPMTAENGVYSFTMEENCTVSVSGLRALYTLSFPKSEEITENDGQSYRVERRISFYDEDDVEITEEVRVIGGEDYKFKLWVSPYYTDEYTVSCGFDVLTPDNDGYYTVREVGDDGEINVTGLTMATSFANVEDGSTGDGSAENPYQISTQVDMFYLAAMINDDYYGGRYSNLHYKLMNDIDMEGEQLYVIGDNSTAVSAFSGTFDGNGHTIKNFRITDEVYDQSSYTLEYLPYVGLFGYAVATVDENSGIVPAVIKNLTLEDYTLQIHTASAGAGAYAGSLLGWGIGAEVSGCRAVNGRIVVTNDNNQIVNAGGLVGRLQGAYGETNGGTVSRAAFVRSCSADVSLQGTGTPHSMGGVVGYLVSADDTAIAYAVDCYSEGTVSGAMRAGGVVGTLGRFSSVANSYTTARITARNAIEGLVLDDFRGAYAGGIAGYAEENTVISGCYAANGRLSATSVQGASFAATGAFAGSFTKPDVNAADYAVLIEYNNQENVASPTEATFTGLGWTANEWDFSGALPVLRLKAAPTTGNPNPADPLDTARNITVSLYNGATQFKTATVAGYLPMTDWYRGESGITEYVENGTGRSWGYYFDEEMTKQVPYGFVPANAQTRLYVGFANYSDVAGTYYVEETAYSDGAYIRLTEDGRAFIRSGGLSYECTYSYNGKASGNIIIYRSCLAALSYGEAEINGGYFAYGGTVSGGVLNLASYLTLVDITSTSEYTQYNYPTDNLRAVKHYDNLVYGEYKNANDVFYLFRDNGTGVRTQGTTTERFTFAPADGGNFTLSFASRSEAVTVSGNGTVDTINNVSVSKMDEFKGSWKKFANSSLVFTFDGEDKVSLGGGAAVDYIVTNGAAVFTIGQTEYRAAFSNGNLVINGETYYVSDNFTGEWYMIGSREQILLSFGGVGAEGYGDATISYTGALSVTLDAEYDVYTAEDGAHLRIYVGDRQYGELIYNAATNTASSSFYSQVYDEYREFEFNIYDMFRGVWTGVADGFDTVTFNGRSTVGNGSEVVLRGNGTERGTYTLTSATSGTMTFTRMDGDTPVIVTYNIVYDETTDRVTFTEVNEQSPESGVIARRDSWYGVVLYDGDTAYEFDGKSNVSGTVNVSDGTALEYTVAADGTVEIDGKALTVTASGFKWGDDKTLVFKSGFAGDWYVSATDAPITVSEVGGDRTATVGGESYDYDPVARTLTRTDGENVTVLSLSSGTEMRITRTTASGTSNVYCIRTANVDGWRGEYKAADGSGWKFDGLGKSIFGNGTVTYTPASGEPVNYTYMINEIGKPYINADVNLLFTEAASGDEDVYVKDGDSFKTVEVDLYYGRIVSVQGDTNTYFFDGNSTVWVKNNSETVYTRKAYNYEIVTSVLCELIDGTTGLRRNARIERAGRTYRMTVTAQVMATAGGATYAFGWSTLWSVSGGTYTKAYTFTVVSEETGQYELTDADGNVFTATLTKKTDGNTLKIAPKEALRATMTGRTYIFGGGTVWLAGENDSYIKAYDYKAVEGKENEYELTDIATKDKYIAKLTAVEGSETFTMELTPKQETANGADGQA